MSSPFLEAQVLQNQVFFETKYEIAILNKIPILPGHCLVIPKRHVLTIHELKSSEIQSLFETVELVALKQKSILRLKV